MALPLHSIDRLIELSPPDRVRAIKAPSYGEPHFEDHFAGFPLMPGALMVESMVQSAQWLKRAEEGFPVADFPLARLERAVFSDYVRPGSVLEITVEKLNDSRYKGTLHIEGKKVGSARFELGHRPLDCGIPRIKRGLDQLDETFAILGGPELLTASEQETRA